MICCRCGYSAEKMSNLFHSIRPSATSASLSGRRHTRLLWWCDIFYNRDDADDHDDAHDYDDTNVQLGHRPLQPACLGRNIKGDADGDHDNVCAVTMFVIMMRVMFNDHHNDRLAAVLRPTAKVSATQRNCPHTRYDVMSLHSKESGFQRCTLATTPPTATS